MEESGAIFIIVIFAFIVFIVIMRFLGAWMLRINDVISELKKISALLKSNQISTKKQVDSGIETNKGLKLMKEGQHKEAISLFREAAKIDPNANVNYYNIACAFSLLKDHSKSLHYIKIAVQSGYNNYEKINADSDLEGVVSSDEFQSFKRNGYR